MIVFEGLNKIYGGGKHAAKDLNLKVNEGEIFGFIGPNGAGKTTTLKMMTGLIIPTSGTAKIAGYDIVTQTIEAKKQLAYVPDHPEVFSYIKGREYLEFVADMYEVPQVEAAARRERYINLFNMGADLDEKINIYSHGMKQKLLVIAAFSVNPRLLILDEPHVGLDPHAQRAMKDIMKEHCENGGTVFFSTHVLDTVENLCHRVAIIREGSIIATGTVEELKGNSDKSLEDIFLEMTNEKDS